MSTHCKTCLSGRIIPGLDLSCCKTCGWIANTKIEWILETQSPVINPTISQHRAKHRPTLSERTASAPRQLSLLGGV